MLGQAIGSILLAYTAISALVPDVFIDTTGLPFCYPMISWVLQIPIVAYVHYPVVSTDMLKKLKFFSPKYVYWRTLMVLYAIAGKYATVPLCNSTWTYNHVKGLWWLTSTNDSLKLSIVHPPCATQDFDKALVLDETKKRKPVIVYVAQFRPEKRHDLVLKEFSKFLNEHKSSDDKPHLVLIGTVRDNDQDKSKVYSLRLLARELNLTSENLTFLLDAPWKNVQEILSSSSFGLNAMWNEHFGMVVVEYMAAGLIPIVHNSGGPKLDLVKERDGVIPGFLFSADSDPDYNKESSALSLSEAFKTAFELDAKTAYKYQQVVYEYAQAFSDMSFADEWDVRVNALLKIDKLKRRKRLTSGRFD
jgi:alpha-1,2-mannosyltransferase